MIGMDKEEIEALVESLQRYESTGLKWPLREIIAEVIVDNNRRLEEDMREMFRMFEERMVARRS